MWRLFWIIHLSERDALKLVILILLDYANKRTHTSIEIETRHTDGQVEISVRDHGPGLTSDQLEHVFDRFFHKGGDASTRGFSLGLPIAKALVEGMRCRITIQSDKNQGSIFKLFLLKVDWPDFYLRTHQKKKYKSSKLDILD